MRIIHPVTVLVGNENEAVLGWIMEWIQGYLGWICALIRVDYSKQGALTLTQTRNSNITWQNPLNTVYHFLVTVVLQWPKVVMTKGDIAFT